MTSVDGEKLWKDIGSRKGEFLVDRTVRELVVESDGGISECHVREIRLRAREEVEEDYKKAIGVRFEPAADGKKQKALLVEIGYLRPARDAADASDT